MYVYVCNNPSNPDLGVPSSPIHRLLAEAARSELACQLNSLKSFKRNTIKVRDRNQNDHIDTITHNLDTDMSSISVEIGPNNPNNPNVSHGEYMSSEERGINSNHNNDMLVEYDEDEDSNQVNMDSTDNTLVIHNRNCCST